MNRGTSMNYPPSREQLNKIHDATLAVLERTGLRVDCLEYYDPLETAGARVDRDHRIVTFPPVLVESTIEDLRSKIASGRRQCLLNGVTNPRWTPPLGCKFGGACIEYLDPEAPAVRAPTELDLVRLLQLGQALENVGFVGNPVTCLLDGQGNGIPGPLQRIKTAALVAKHTTKCGSTEVWNERELEFLIEIGEIVRDGKDAYQAQPCFVTAKETIAPLHFPAEDGRILLMLARRNLPCTIIPMPLTGGTCPCSPLGNVIVANAEILGVMSCLHAVAPDAMTAGGVISGIMDMATASASFSAPEALVQDACLAHLYDQLYGQDLAIGTGYIDAKYPGGQALAEKALKMQAAAQLGRWNFPVGLLAGGKRFSPVQAVLELEVAEYIRGLHQGVNVDETDSLVDVIRNVGIGGEYISHAHTLDHFRKALWRPELFDRRTPASLEEDRAQDMIQSAREKVRAIWRRDNLYRIEEEKAKAIDNVLRCAERILR